MATSDIPSQAFVTLVTTDSYVLGALVLAHSLRKSKTTKHLVCLTTTNISLDKRAQLVDVFDYVVSVDELDSGDAAHLALLRRPELGTTFTKLHAFNLTQYNQCVFLDADTVALQNVDDIFERDVEFAAAPDVGWPDCFNSGVFLFRPSAETFQALLLHASTVGSFDGGDQGLLNSFFSWWSTASSAHRLPFTYNMTANASYGYLPAFEQFKSSIKIVHFIGALKPWHGMPHPGPGMHTIVSLFEQWWRIHDDFMACLSSSCSYKTLTGSRPTRSPHRDAAVNPPPLRESATRSSFDAHRPISGNYLSSASFSDVQRAIDQLAVSVDESEQADDSTPQPGRQSEEPSLLTQSASLVQSLEARALEERQEDSEDDQ